MSRYLYAFMPNQSGLDELDAHGGENLRISLDNQTAIVEFEPFVGGQPQTVPSELEGKLKPTDAKYTRQTRQSYSSSVLPHGRAFRGDCRY